MLVKIEEIREGGLELREPISAAALDAAFVADGRDTGFRARSDAQLLARLSKVSGGVLLEGRLAVRSVAPCKRCLVEVPLEVPVDFTLNLVSKEALEGAPEDGDEDDGKAERAGSFDLSDADQELFDGKTIDLDPILREQVLLALPVSVVCGEECKGLCTVCGQNLNEAECGCERKVLDPRLAKLKEIKLN